MRCDYSMDDNRCVREFAHDGPHHARFSGLEDPVKWPYLDVHRHEDIERGYARCRSWATLDGRDLACRLPEGHDAIHSDGGDNGWSETGMDLTLVQAAPEPAPYEIPEHVQGALDERDDAPAVRLAMRGPDGRIVRYDEVVEYQIHPSGALLICTRTEDVGYAPHAWSSLTAEPALHPEGA